MDKNTAQRDDANGRVSVFSLVAAHFWPKPGLYGRKLSTNALPRPPLGTSVDVTSDILTLSTLDTSAHAALDVHPLSAAWTLPRPPSTSTHFPTSTAHLRPTLGHLLPQLIIVVAQEGAVCHSRQDRPRIHFDKLATCMGRGGALHRLLLHHTRKVSAFCPQGTMGSGDEFFFNNFICS